VLEATPANTVLVVDEAYYEYALHDDDYPDVLAMLDARVGPWIVLRTFSKAWGLAGLRVGYGMADSAELVGLMDKVRSPFNVNMAAQRGAGGLERSCAHAQRRGDHGGAARGSAQTAAGAGRARPAAARPAHCALGSQLPVSRPGPSQCPGDRGAAQAGRDRQALEGAGFEHFLRVSIGTEKDNARFVLALLAAMEQTERVTA
jgi:histidinol-phosphate aminotransferase